MYAAPECLECLYAQTKRALAPFHITSPARQALHIPTFSQITINPAPPPFFAIAVYDSLSKVANSADIYQARKALSIQKAKECLAILKEQGTCAGQADSLEWGIRLAALGNVIDYGSASEFAIESCLFDMDSMEFGAYDLGVLRVALTSAKELVYIGDNAGEDVFDSEFVRILRMLYPALKVYYFTRGAPIINDITMQDIIDNHSPIADVCEVVDSGVRSPGFIYDLANSRAKALYDGADVVLAKGMGNFECLESSGDARVFMLFKIKCAVVARTLQAPQGQFMLRNCKRK